MTDLVSVASNAVSAYQRSLGTISNNIANVATEGYSRQEVVLAANPVAKIGNTYLGTGVVVERIQRQFNTFIESNLRNSNSDLASQEPMVNYANRVIDVMGGPAMGLNSALDQFFGSARNLSADPASSVLRGSFVRDAENLATRFGQLSSQLDLVQSETDQLVVGNVNEMNTIVKQLAEINIQMTKQKSAADQPPDLLDLRDKLLNDLSGYARLNTLTYENGSVKVSLGPSFTRDVIIDGVKSLRIGTSFNSASPEKVSLVIDPYGTPSPLTSLTSGKLSGLLSFREQVLGSSRSALEGLANKVVTEVNNLHQGGIDAYGNTGVALFSIGPAGTSAAGSMKVAFTDPLRVATAAQFRVVAAPNNTSGVEANVSYVQPLSTGPKALNEVLANNPNANAALSLTVTPGNPVGAVATIPNGLQNVNILMGEASAGQQLQVFTRDGRQIMGAPVDTTLQGQLMTEANGFVPNAGYSSAYLNVSGTSGYKQMNVFYGAKSDVRQELQWDMADTDPAKHKILSSTPLPALIEGTRMQAGMSTLAAGLFTLNGTSLGALSASTGKTLQASDLKTWVNAAGVTGVTASATNEVRIPASQIKLDLPLWLKGGATTAGAFVEVSKSGSASWATPADLVTAINAGSANSRIQASLSASGELVLRNTAGNEGEDIAISGASTAGSATANAVSLTATTYTGQISITRALVSGASTPVELGFGTGTPADLGKLGFRTGAYIKGSANEDLLVFVTGAGSAKVSASYSGAAVNAKQALRTQPLQIRFDSATSFTITDANTGTVLAKRQFNPAKLEPGVVYQGLGVTFSSPPKAGDIYSVDGNRDGTGNNENILVLAALENKAVMGGGKTIGAAYIDHVNDMGNIARQAAISQSALQVVHEQAVTARDKVSGVSLDEEAANLIRFQQAYQAAAKILQVASQLFDSVLQVR